MQTRSSASKAPQPTLTPLRRSQRLLNQAHPLKSQDSSAQKSEFKKTPVHSADIASKKPIKSGSGSTNGVNSTSGLRRSPRLNGGSVSKSPEEAKETKFVETKKAASRRNTGKSKGDKEKKEVERKEREVCVGLKAVTPARREGCGRNDEVGIKRNVKRKREEGGDGNVRGWTREQELALQRAYFAAKPTPNFWNKVSRLVLSLLLDI